MDGVNAAARASVTTGRATTGGRSLRRGVADLVTRAAATTLESVVETDPVSSLVGESLSMANKVSDFQPNEMKRY